MRPFAPMPLRRVREPSTTAPADAPLCQL